MPTWYLPIRITIQLHCCTPFEHLFPISTRVQLLQIWVNTYRHSLKSRDNCLLRQLWIELWSSLITALRFIITFSRMKSHALQPFPTLSISSAEDINHILLIPDLTWNCRESKFNLMTTHHQFSQLSFHSRQRPT